MANFSITGVSDLKGLNPDEVAIASQDLEKPERQRRAHIGPYWTCGQSGARASEITKRLGGDTAEKRPITRSRSRAGPCPHPDFEAAAI